MNNVLEILLAEASTLEEYEVLLEMFGEHRVPEWGDKDRRREERRGYFSQRVLKAQAVIENWGWGRVEAKKKAPLFADNLKKCSCWMCRSPRTLYRVRTRRDTQSKNLSQWHSSSNKSTKYRREAKDGNSIYDD